MAQNRMSKTLSYLDKVPAPLRTRLRSLLMGRMVPLVGTAELSVEELTAERCVVSVQNRRKVQNHIGSVHAAAMALMAETATGFVVGMNVPDDRVPVIKTLKVDFKKRAKGALRAVATLTAEQREAIAAQEKGETSVAVTVTDGEGKEPIACEMLWAWTPKRRA